MPYKTRIRLLRVAQNSANGFPARLLALPNVVGIALWLFLYTALYTALLPGWGLNRPVVLIFLLVWVLAGGWYGAWKTKHEFHEQAGFGWRRCLSRAYLTMFSNVLVAAMAPPLLFITTSSIIRNAGMAIDDTSTTEMMAPYIAWGSIGVSLAAAVVALMVLNEHIHSAISRKVRLIQRESETTASSPLRGGATIKYFGDDPSGSGRTVKAYLVLVGHAVRRETITYGALKRKIDETPPNVRNHLKLIFDYCEKNKLPRLVTLVVLRKSGEPGDDYSGPTESIYVDREAVYAYDWLELVPPTINELSAHT